MMRSVQGSHPTWKTWYFVIYFYMPGKCLEFAIKKSRKKWIFLFKPRKNVKLINLVFQDSLFKVSFTQKIIQSNLCHIYIINTNTVIQSQIDLRFHYFYLEITWKIHGISFHQKSANRVSGINRYLYDGVCLSLG